MQQDPHLPPRFKCQGILSYPPEDPDHLHIHIRQPVVVSVIILRAICCYNHRHHCLVGINGVILGVAVFIARDYLAEWDSTMFTINPKSKTFSLASKLDQ